MKPLHTLLKEYIAKSNYTIYQLAMDSGINRTTLQKALSGERPISQENLSKSSHSLDFLSQKKENWIRLF